MSVFFMKINSTELRRNIYQLLDSVLNTGIPLEIERNGKILKIVADNPPSKLKNIKPIQNLVIGNPDELNHMDWSKEWKNDISGY